ncbi:hypothetical protein F53441_14112 [Fusarium austroafricanum]|uniref:Uncharacterized protein n=1 Tax=Fusarium austroafricanum TaxID=2364996 RepID=A0A8H4JJN9_9HYPO|nr:hypothetical protein F53441_14112 [Fusarium austroafricanum]
MTENLETSDFNRLACIIPHPHSIPPDGPKSCRTGEVGLNHFRKHLREKHECKCLGLCQNPLHRSSEMINDILSIRKGRADTIGEVCTKMFQRANPGILDTPAPYIPSVAQLLAVAQRPTAQFHNDLAVAFANSNTLNAEDAVETVDYFLQLLPIFLDVVSRTGPLPDSQAMPRVPGEPGSSRSLGNQETLQPLQVPTPASDGNTAFASQPNDCIYVGGDERVTAWQAHHDFLEKEWDGHFGHSADS